MCMYVCIHIHMCRYICVWICWDMYKMYFYRCLTYSWLYQLILSTEWRNVLSWSSGVMDRAAGLLLSGCVILDSVWHVRNPAIQCKSFTGYQVIWRIQGFFHCQSLPEQHLPHVHFSLACRMVWKWTRKWSVWCEELNIDARFLGNLGSRGPSHLFGLCPHFGLITQALLSFLTLWESLPCQLTLNRPLAHECTRSLQEIWPHTFLCFPNDTIVVWDMVSDVYKIFLYLYILYFVGAR